MPTGSKNGKSRHVAVRLPHDVDEAVKKISQERGVSASQVIIEALREYLQKEDVAE